MPFIDSVELALILGEPHSTVHRVLTDLLADGIAGRASHGTVHLPSSRRYYLTASGIGFNTSSDFVQAYPMSREWLTLLIRRMDAVALIYRLAASLSPGIDGLRSRVEFHRRGRFDAIVTLHDGRDFGVVRQGLALRRRSLYDRLRAIAEYDYSHRPDTVLILVPSVWEERLTTRFCEERNLRDCYVAVESRAALERRDRRLWCKTSWVIGSSFFSLEHVSSQGRPGRRPSTESPERKRASIPRPERMVQAAPAFGISRGEVRAHGFLMNMSVVFQEFVTTALREALGVSERTFRSDRSVRGVTLDEARKVHLYPDLSWWDGQTCTFVGDAKYKKVTGESVPNADLYQLLAYVTALDLPGGLLIYAQGEAKPVVHEVRRAGKRLEIAALDLSGTLDEVLARVESLADRVRDLRERGVSGRSHATAIPVFGSTE